LFLVKIFRAWATCLGRVVKPKRREIQKLQQSQGSIRGSAAAKGWLGSAQLAHGPAGSTKLSGLLTLSDVLLQETLEQAWVRAADAFLRYV